MRNPLQGWKSSEFDSFILKDGELKFDPILYLGRSRKLVRVFRICQQQGLDWVQNWCVRFEIEKFADASSRR